MAATKVTIFNNGPVIIEGDFSIHDAAGAEYGLAGRTRIGLCRCGLSAKKPFCDGTHGREGFSSECSAHNLPEPVKKP
ncbi:MAG: CDGSH iron-sulfur domain-containing protein [Bryobacterales bacterium]|nr:CDGSH iron-sulfur domain-containing protein [Bryobacterales bacterium]